MRVADGHLGGDGSPVLVSVDKLLLEGYRACKGAQPRKQHQGYDDGVTLHFPPPFLPLLSCFSSGARPVERIFMKRLSVSNQKGAPKETAITVMNQPPQRLRSQSHQPSHFPWFFSDSVMALDSWSQPSTSPISPSSSLVRWFTSSELSVSAGLVGLGLAASAYSTVSNGRPTSCTRCSALSTTVARTAGSIQRRFASCSESAFVAKVIRTAAIRVTVCVCRLYQPDTRSIWFSYHCSIKRTSGRPSGEIALS